MRSNAIASDPTSPRSSIIYTPVNFALIGYVTNGCQGPSLLAWSCSDVRQLLSISS